MRVFNSKVMDGNFLSELLQIVNPEPDEDGSAEIEFPHPDLLRLHALDAESYIKANGSFYEGSTMHAHTHVRGRNEVLSTLGKSIGVPNGLFVAAIRTFADSVISYEEATVRLGDFRYYPPAILTFWSGFECFVRFASTMMVETVREVPEEVADFLLERNRHYPVLERFHALLEHGYGYRANRGASWWQRLEQARGLRDRLTHIRIETPRGVSAEEVLTFFENVLIALIKPSVDLRRSLLLGQYRLYNAVRFLQGYASFTERPMFLEWEMDRGLFGFHCNFENVDTDRFPDGRDHEAIRRLTVRE